MPEQKNEKACKDPQNGHIIARFDKLSKDEQVDFLGGVFGIKPMPKFATENVENCTNAQLLGPDAVRAVPAPPAKPASSPKR